MTLFEVSLGGEGAFAIWLVDMSGNVAISASGLALLGRIETLCLPAFTSTEQAMAWGSRLNAEQHATLVDIQRSSSNAARIERDLQTRVNLATQSQLIREAAEAFVPGASAGKNVPIWTETPASEDHGSSRN